MKPIAKLALRPCTIVERENRFVVTVRYGNAIRRALLRNTGRLLDLIRPGYTALCLEREGGRTECEIIGVLVDRERAALVDPHTQARIFELAASAGMIPWLGRWRITKKEVTVPGSRLDYSIGDGTNTGFLELKSAAYWDGKRHAMYPDCPSERGLRHIKALLRLNARGYRTVIVFVAAHPKAWAFRPNADADKEIALELARARSMGVEVRAVKLFLDRAGNIFFEDGDLPVEL